VEGRSEWPGGQEEVGKAEGWREMAGCQKEAAGGIEERSERPGGQEAE
jgi:hypothetical protein